MRAHEFQRSAGTAERLSVAVAFATLGILGCSDHGSDHSPQLTAGTVAATAGGGGMLPAGGSISTASAGTSSAAGSTAGTPPAGRAGRSGGGSGSTAAAAGSGGMASTAGSGGAAAGSGGMASTAGSGGMATTAGSGGVATAGGCTRELLKSSVDAYFNAIAAHSASTLQLASDVKYTENGKMTPVGDGFWKTAARRS